MEQLQQMPQADNGKKHILLYIWVFLCFFITDSPFANYAPMGYTFKVMVPMILGVLYAAYYLLLKRSKLDVARTVLLLFVLGTVALSSFLGNSGLRLVLAYIGMWLFGAFFTRIYSFESFRRVFLRCVLFVAAFSLIVYFMLLLFPASRSLFPTVAYSNGATVDLFFTTFRLTSGPVRRNYGMFWEPGTYQAYLNLALLFLFKEEGGRFLPAKALLLIVAIVTTFSTTGYIVMAAILCFGVLSGGRAFRGPLAKCVFVLSVIVLVCVALANFGLVEDLVFDKMEAGNNSYDSRMLSIVGNLQLLLYHPILGVGYGMSADALNLLVDSSSGFIHQTNTFTNYLATFGVILGGFFIWLWWKLARVLSDRWTQALPIFLIFVLITSGENFLGSFAFTMFLAYGFRLLDVKLTK